MRPARPASASMEGSTIPATATSTSRPGRPAARPQTGCLSGALATTPPCPARQASPATTTSATTTSAAARFDSALSRPGAHANVPDRSDPMVKKRALPVVNEPPGAVVERRRVLQGLFAGGRGRRGAPGVAEGHPMQHHAHLGSRGRPGQGQGGRLEARVPRRPPVRDPDRAVRAHRPGSDSAGRPLRGQPSRRGHPRKPGALPHRPGRPRGRAALQPVQQALQGPERGPAGRGADCSLHGRNRDARTGPGRRARPSSDPTWARSR